MMQTHMTENRKPAFRWLGTKEDLVGPATRKRMAGICKRTQPPIYSGLQTKRGQKRVPGSDGLMMTVEPSTAKRTALKPLQPRCVNTMSPIPRDVINKPVPLYPRAPQIEAPLSENNVASPTAPLPATPSVAPVAPGLPIGLTLGTSGE